MDDIAIIKMLHHTPQEGLHQLIGAYRGLVGKICANILAGHQEDIEEAIADTFISIWKNVPKLDPQRGSLKGLLIITARHQAINRLHQISKHQLMHLEPELIYDKHDLVEALLAEEDSQLLQQLVNLLPEPNREIFVRRHYLLEPVRDIAARLHMQEKQISNRLYQSKLKLRQDLQATRIFNE